MDISGIDKVSKRPGWSESPPALEIAYWNLAKTR